MVASNNNNVAVTVEELIKKNPDVNPFLIRKWEYIFTMFFDRNSSHQMDWGDFYLVVRKVRDVYGAESVQTDFAKQSLAALWEGITALADSDKDQLISIDEWINLLKKTQKQKDTSKWFTDYNNFMFKLFDVSCDGVMDIAEYNDGMSVYGFKTHASTEAFKKFAVDKKGAYIGKVPPKEWTGMFNDFFWSEDKTLPGNNLFGILDF